MRFFVHLTVLVFLASCALQPSQPSRSSSSNPGGRAKTCSVSGFRPDGTETQISPSMTVSSDGYCGQRPSLVGTSTQRMEPTTHPQHGMLVTTGDNTMAPNFRYYPREGYTGSDSFTVLIGGSSQPISATFTVTVVP